MFCEECGAKNESGAAFCEKCGHKLQEVKETKKVVKQSKPMSTKTKVIIGLVVAIVAVFIGGYMFISNSLKPEKVATKYFKAYVNGDADAVYKALDLEDSEFVSKELLEETLKNDSIEVENYSVDDVDKGDLTTTVTIKYVKEGSSKERTKTIYLSKDSKKKWLLFDKWNVDASDLIAHDYLLSVPKNTTIKIGDVKLKAKYKKDSSFYSDTYKIPSILKGKYDVEVTYESGLKFTGSLNVWGSYGSISSSSLKLVKSDKKAITAELKKDVEAIYAAAIEKKDFDEIKELFPEDARDNVKSRYDSLKENIHSSYNDLKEFKLNDLEVSSVYVYDDYVSVNVKIKYDYKIEYTYVSDKKEYSAKDKEYSMNIRYVPKKDKLELSEFLNLISYFSHY